MAAKLPRRTMSMAKRATRIAEEAADLDAVESVLGAPSEYKLGALQYIIAWVAGVGGLLLIITALGLVCRATQVEPDWSPPGALSREEQQPTTIQAYYQVGEPDDGRMGRSGSPFPKAQTVDPIILEVECPAGTVHISTGADADDSVCVRGVLAGATPEEQPEPTPEEQPEPTATPTSYPNTLPSTGR